MIVVLVEPSCSVTATQRFRFLALETALPAFQVDWQRPPYVECGKPRIRCQAFCAPNIHLQLHHSAISTIIAQTTTALPWFAMKLIRTCFREFAHRQRRINPNTSSKQCIAEGANAWNIACLWLQLRKCTLGVVLVQFRWTNLLHSVSVAKFHGVTFFCFSFFLFKPIQLHRARLYFTLVIRTFVQRWTNLESVRVFQHLSELRARPPVFPPKQWFLTRAPGHSLKFVSCDVESCFKRTVYCTINALSHSSSKVANQEYHQILRHIPIRWHQWSYSKPRFIRIFAKTGGTDDF